jgi:hypothetical protein
MEKPVVDQKRNIKLVVSTWEDWPDYDEPGKAAIFAPSESGCVLHFACPGCGRWGGIHIGFVVKAEQPGWLLASGDQKDAASWTLSPSINCVGCCGWHGHLTNGIFTSC